MTSPLIDCQFLLVSGKYLPFLGRGQPCLLEDVESSCQQENQTWSIHLEHLPKFLEKR